MQVNEHLLRVSSSLIPIEDELFMGQELRVKIDVTVTQITEKDLQNGEIDRIYTLKGIIAEVEL